MCFLCQSQTDHSGEFTASSSTDDFVVSGGKWGSSGAFGTSGGIVTWSLPSAGQSSVFSQFYTGQSVSLNSFLNFDPVAVLKSAFDAWSNAANIKFMQVDDRGGALGSGTDADIRIVGATLDGSFGTVGRAFLPNASTTSSQSAASGDIVFDSSETSFWTASTFFLVALHEIGHSIGLQHENNVTAIMNPFINTNLTGLQADDVNGARAIYGQPSSAGEVYRLDGSRQDLTVFDGVNSATYVGTNEANTISGGSASETIVGEGGNDTLLGNGGSDRLVGGAGLDNLNGGDGFDVAVFSASIGQSQAIRYGDQAAVITSTNEGSDFLRNIEGIQFADGSVNTGDASIFQALDYIASYTDLIAAFGDNGDAGFNHYVIYGASEGRKISFDGLSYVAAYDDLIAAFGTSAVAGAQHYIVYGNSEGRNDRFDADQYLENYSDLVAAFGNNEVAAIQHYINYGRSEGRVDFNSLEYIASYDDLRAAFGVDGDAAINHYNAYGRGEGRESSFDGLSYIASYGDLIAAFGASKTDGAAHYILYGVSEQRTTTFDPAAYLAAHSDLVAAFGDDLDAAAEHYIVYGFNEGRSIA